MFVQLTRDYLGKPPGERIDVDEADAKHLIEAGVASAVTDDPIGPAVSRALDGALVGLGDALAGVVDRALKQFADAQVRSRRHAVPLLFGDSGGDPHGKSFGDWLLCVRKGDQKALADRYGSYRVDWEGSDRKVSLTGASGTQGGYTVPAEYLPRLMQLASENSVVRPRATIVPMTSRSLYVPTLDHTTAPGAGDTAMFGGLVARWTEEAAALAQTEPQFKQIELVAHELSGHSKISNALLSDNAVGLEALLMAMCGRAIGWYEDQAFLRGNGVGKPLGVLSASALIAVSRSGASAFTLADAAGMLGRLLPGWDPLHTVWAIHPTVLVKLFQMS